MGQLLYFLVLKPLSFLPLNVLYFFSDILFIFLYYVVGYRKKVVLKNLSNSFPHKSGKELETIQKKFYRHLADLVVENIKLFSISLNELKRRFKVINPEILEAYFHQGRSIILAGAHYNNWEFVAMGLDSYISHQTVVIYSPLKNKFLNDKMARSRTKYGIEIVQKGLVPRAFVQNKTKLTVTVFGADQSPTFSKQVVWTNFLNQETAIHFGTELFAVKYDYPVIFIKMHKVARGRYEAELELLSEYPSGLKRGEITKLHTKCLEAMIVREPANWLWSHNRWKRKKTEEELATEMEEEIQMV